MTTKFMSSAYGIIELPARFKDADQFKGALFPRRYRRGIAGEILAEQADRSAGGRHWPTLPATDRYRGQQDDRVFTQRIW